VKLLEILSEADRYFDAAVKRIAAANRAKLPPKAKKPKPVIDKAEVKRWIQARSPEAIWDKVQDAMQFFPDGDPLDHLIPYLNKWEIDMTMVDAAVREFTHSKHGYSEWLSATWHELQRQAIGDAKRGHVDRDSVFYTVNADGKIKRSDNPWGQSWIRSLHDDDLD
jgi:hypothetical protein